MINADSVCLWASTRDTYDWATKTGAAWPCSTLSDRRIFAAFDSNGLYDIAIDGKDDTSDFDVCEFNALCADLLAEKLPKDHPAYLVAVGQFI